MTRSRIPVTVVGGFLGAGKTTLLNVMLSAQQQPRMAVMVNDFGAINIDAALIARRDGKVIALTNGCVCCAIGGDLTEALIGVIESAEPPEAIIIEASGVSDPWRIAQVSLADPALSLDQVVVLVDASGFATLLEDARLTDTLLRQLRAADVIVINKCDLTERAELEATRRIVAHYAARTVCFETTNADLPREVLSGASLKPSNERFRRIQKAVDQHNEIFAQYTFFADKVVSASGLRDLIKHMPLGVLRCKGLLETNEGLLEVQFAGRHGSVRRANPEADERGVVVIALRQGSDADLIAAAVNAALMPCNADGDQQKLVPDLVPAHTETHP